MNAYLFVNLTLEGISVIFLHLFYVYDNSFPSYKILLIKRQHHIWRVYKVFSSLYHKRLFNDIDFVFI